MLIWIQITRPTWVVLSNGSTCCSLIPEALSIILRDTFTRKNITQIHIFCTIFSISKGTVGTIWPVTCVWVLRKTIKTWNSIVYRRSVKLRKIWHSKPIICVIPSRDKAYTINTIHSVTIVFNITFLKALFRILNSTIIAILLIIGKTNSSLLKLSIQIGAQVIWVALTVDSTKSPETVWSIYRIA